MKQIPHLRLVYSDNQPVENYKKVNKIFKLYKFYESAENLF